MNTQLLIPAIVQDSQTQQVLMLGYMNAEALAKTKQAGVVTFWSRSKQRLWQKGETSGNYLRVVSIKEDCDNDTLLIRVKPAGPTCHTGSVSCFANDATNAPKFTLDTLVEIIRARSLELPENSYTTKLLTDDPSFVLSKITEEAGEVVQAAERETKQRLAEESADLLYHLLVLLRKQQVEFSQVIEVLERRSG